MTLLLIISLLFRVTAVVLSVVLLRRIRDWRMGFVTLTLTLMTYRQGVTLWSQPRWWPPTRAGIEVEWSGLAVSVLALLMVGFLGKLLTERKQAGARISESEARYRRAEAGTTDGLWEWNIATGEEYCSPRWLEILGYPPDEAPKVIAEFIPMIHPDDRARAKAESDQSQRDHRPFAVEMRLRRKDGTYLPVLSRGQIELDAGGKPARMTGAITDISARQQAGAALRASEARFRTLTESTSAAVFIFQGEHFCYVNPAGEALTGYPAAALQRMKYWELAHPEFRELVRARGRRRERGEDLPDRYEVKILTQTGEERWVDYTVGATEYQGQPAGIGTAFDITARKQAEAALDETQRQLKSLIANLPGVVYRCRNDANWTTEFVSEGVFQLFGYPAADFMEHRRSIGPMIHPDDQGRIWEEIQAALRERRRYELAYRIITAGGAEKWVGEHGAGVFAAGGTLQALEGFAIDITARRRSEETETERNKLAQQISMIATTAPGALASFRLRPDGRAGFPYASPAWLSLFAVTQAEVAEDTGPLLKRLHPDDVAHFLATIQQSAQSLADWRDEFRVLHPDRGELWVAGHSSPVREADGSILWHGFITDITERRRKDEALRAQHRELENLYATTPVGLALIDRDLRFVRINGQLAAINGQPVEAHIGRTIEEALPELAPVLTPIYRRVLDGNTPVLNVEIHGETPAEPGVMRDWLASYYPLRAADGSVSGISIAVMDITAQKRAEAALREKEQLLSESQRIAHIGGWHWDLAGPIRWTEETYRVYGVAPETFTLNAETFLNLIHPEDRPAMQRWVAACAAGEKPGELEFRALPPDGSVRVLRGRGELVSGGGSKPAVMAGTVQDITARKQAEQALQESQAQLRALLARLQRAGEEERRRVSREIHDELGQLLTGLKMDLRWLERKLSGPALPPALNPLLDRVVAASQLADQTITTVQTIAEELRPGVLDKIGLGAAIAQELRLFEKRSDVRGTAVLAEPAPALPAAVANELFCICRETLTNVARHAGAKHVVISLTAADGAAVLEVCDDGVGITAADLNAPRSLGLLGIKERAAQCGGTVAFERNQPRGTKVTVRIPLASGG